MLSKSPATAKKKEKYFFCVRQSNIHRIYFFNSSPVKVRKIFQCQNFNTYLTSLRETFSLKLNKTITRISEFSPGSTCLPSRTPAGWRVPALAVTPLLDQLLCPQPSESPGNPWLLAVSQFNALINPLLLSG